MRSASPRPRRTDPDRAAARRRIAWAGRGLAWLVILGVGGVLLVAVLVPRVAGATPYVVLTGSMRPDLPPGTLVVVRPVPAERIQAGSVITYQLHSGESAVVTHRVVSVAVDGRGERTFVMRGDANGAVDPAPVRAVQVRGELWYAVPWLGRVTTLVGPETRRVVTLALVSGLLLYAALMFTTASRRGPVARHRAGTGAP